MAKHPSLRGHSKWSRKVAKQIPYFDFSGSLFYACDNAPQSVVEKRQLSFRELITSQQEKNVTSVILSNQLDTGVSDVNFIDAYRVPFPFRKTIQKNIPFTGFVQESKGVAIKDVDGNWNFDLSGSYGVNLFGYDFYKTCLADAQANTEKLGPVLGPYHPIIIDNVSKLRQISGLDEVSFHMSGTEAVMQAVRLARYHTGRSHLVRFCGAYHGWWDGVQPGIGNQRKTSDVYTLADVSEKTLHVLRTRKDIACILINPLQALHPNSDASSDASLINSSRQARFDKQAYTKWLFKLRKVCTDNSIVMIMDEVFTGFRFAHSGAQEFFNVRADLVTYGKTLGGGLPVGVVCGKSSLMKRFKNEQPANVSFARGTFNSHPLIMASMNAFLKKIESDEIQDLYIKSEETWNTRAQKLNDMLIKKDLPVRVVNLISIWTITYELPSAYNWMFQFYLRDEGLFLSWVGSGRFIFSHNYNELDFDQVIARFIKAAKRMKSAGWWHQQDSLTNTSISKTLSRKMLLVRFPLLSFFITNKKSLSLKGSKKHHV